MVTLLICCWMLVAGATDRSDLSEVSRASNGASPQSVTILRDACGRIICDGLFYYHYDAWGRLVQVNVAKYDGGGGPDGTGAWISAALVRHLTYDGLGRLIRTQSPVTPPSIDPSVGEVELLEPVRSERLYYDGVRRIAEVLVDPVDPKAAALLSEDLQEQQAAQQTGSESGGNGSGAGGETANATYEKVLSPPVRLTREYVWGPGESHQGIDELLAQFGGSVDEAGEPIDRSKAWWVIQDLSGDAVALIEKPASTTQTPNPPAVVAWQATYEPYGGVIAARTLRPHPPLRAGHKGLFADNLDAQGFTALVPDERPVLAARLPLHYHVRNRSLLAGEPTDEDGNPRTWAGGMGRFLQHDPNATGVAVSTSLARHGRPVLEPSPAPELESWTADGVSTLGYCGAAPTRQGDPTGLFIGPTTTMDLWSDHAQNTLDWGNTIRGQLGVMFGDFQLNQSDDLDWAMDWSADDYDYSRTRALPGMGNWSEGSSVTHGDPSADGPMGPVSRGVPGMIGHHIATNKFWKAKPKWSKQFNALFKNAGLSMNNRANILEMSKELHSRGRHSDRYHQMVLDRLRRAVDGLTGEEAQLALKNELEKIKELIRADPGILYRK